MITIAVLITYKTTIIEYIKGKFIGFIVTVDKKDVCAPKMLKNQGAIQLLIIPISNFSLLLPVNIFPCSYFLYLINYFSSFLDCFLTKTQVLYEPKIS